MSDMSGMNDMHDAVGKHAALQAVAEIQRELAGEIELLGGVLCADADCAARHMTSLQAIDLIAQTQYALAKVISAGMSEEEIHAVGLDSLRLRLSVVPDHEPDFKQTGTDC